MDNRAPLAVVHVCEESRHHRIVVESGREIVPTAPLAVVSTREGATRSHDDTGGGGTGLFCRGDRSELEGSVEFIETLPSGERHLFHRVGSWRFV